MILILAQKIIFNLLTPWLKKSNVKFMIPRYFLNPMSYLSFVVLDKHAILYTAFDLGQSQ